MKHLKFLLSIIIIIITMAVISCSSDDDNDNNIYTGEKTALPTPDNFSTDYENKRISWDKIDNAENYYWFIDLINKGTVSTNHINLNSIAEDQWTTITVQAIAPVNTRWDNSPSKSYSFIFTNKMLLETPANFRYQIINETNPTTGNTIKKVKITWDAIANANKYNVTFEKTNDNIILKESKSVTEPSFTTNLISATGYSYYIYVKAIPETESSSYVSSKTGGARIPVE
ncbi:hypothetical protein [Coprobacter sp.]